MCWQVEALSLCWDAGGDALLGEGSMHPVRGIGLVADEQPGFGQAGYQAFSRFVIAALAFGQVQEQGPSPSIAHDMQLGGQAATTSSDTSG